MLHQLIMLHRPGIRDVHHVVNYKVSREELTNKKCIKITNQAVGKDMMLLS
jgi:hypothetical protein